MRTGSQLRNGLRALAIAAAIAASPANGALPPAGTLSGANEVPPVQTTASATSTIVIGGDHKVRGTIETTGIDGTMAHVHEGAPGTNGPVLVKLIKSAPGVWTVPDGTELTAAQYDSYRKGMLYVNVHSEAHPSGELRMQLQP